MLALCTNTSYALLQSTKFSFEVGIATFMEEGAPDSSVDSHPQVEGMHRFFVCVHSRTLDLWMQDEDGALTYRAQAKRSAVDNRLVLTLIDPQTLTALPYADMKRAVACLASVCGLTTGREAWHVLPDDCVEHIEFAVHRKGGVRLIDSSTSACVVGLSLRGRRLTNRNKKQPPTPEEPYVFEAKTTNKALRQDTMGRRDGGEVESFAHPFIAILRELFLQATTGSVSLQDCIVPWKGGPGGQPNGRLECYDRKERCRVFVPVLCFSIDEGTHQRG